MEYIRYCAIKELIDAYDRCLRRIRSNGHPTLSNSKKKNIDCVLIMRDQENTYDSESLYALFSDIDATRIKTIRDALRSEKWHFLQNICPKKDSASMTTLSPIFAWRLPCSR